MKLQRLAPWLVLAVVGCAGTDADVSTSGSFALDAVPLPTVPQELWQPARAGCEAALAPATGFGIADGAPDLVVALGESGVVCVDTYSAVESELTLVDPEAIDALWLGYMASLQEAEPFDDGRRHVVRSAEPSPTARIPDYASPVQAEPQPQPSRPALPGIDQAPASAEPQPQPSDPTPEATAEGEGDAQPGIDMSTDLDCDPPTEPVTPRVR